jgi:two-component system OmpR family response regulator
VSTLTVRKVLLADDDPDLRRLGQLSLGRIGKWQVVLASSGEAAVDLAVREQPDLVVMDVSMPGMDGPTALRALRARPETAAIPVVFITARALPAEIASHVAAGAAGVVTKPFDPLKLPGQLLAILAKSSGAALPAAPSDVLASLAEESKNYRASLHAKVVGLAEALARAPNEAAAAEDARVRAHKLRGSAAMHEMPSVARAAGRIEDALAFRARSDPAKGWAALEEALAELRGAIEREG